jgi:N-acetylmuramoyl-L-alanine amidase
MVYPVHGESDISTYEVQDIEVQETGNGYENDFQKGKKLITIQRGETLSGIAQRNQTTIAQIISMNAIKEPDKIKEGQKLWVNSSEDTSLLQLNHVVAALAEVAPSKESPSKKGEEAPKTVEIFVSNEKESVAVAGDIPKDIPKDTPKDSPKESVKDVPNGAPNIAQGNDLQSAQRTVESSATPSRGEVKFTKEEVELLARVIYAEARGEDFEGQVAVGAVVLNRLEDSRFPKTIEAVIYQQGAFTAVLDKQIHLTPDEVAYRAAEAALAGKDPTGGAIYYYNPKTATDRWIKSRPVIKTIGNHTFSI